MPKQYSETLKKIYDDPAYYAEILENNKGNLKTIASYEKSKKAVNELLGRTKCIKAKMNLVIEYLLSQCEDITPLALQKVLYYIQGFYNAFYKKIIFSAMFEQMV